MKKQRKPVNFRAFFKKVARVVSFVVVAALIGVSGFEIYSLTARTTFLRLERIEVNRLKHLTREDIILQAGIKTGDDLLGLRLSRIGEQLSKNPWIEKVNIRRFFPDTLTIDVVEREPLAVVNMGYLYYLDTKGEIFKPLNEGDRLDFPVVTGIVEEDLTKDPAGTREALRTVMELIARLQGSNVFSLTDVSEIHYDKGHGFTLFTALGGVPVKLGASNFEEKLARFEKIYQGLKTQLPGLEYVDLNYNDKIIVKKV